MELPVTISVDREVHHFEVGEYLYHNEEQCKYKVSENGVYVASFEPDVQGFFHSCQNPVALMRRLLHFMERNGGISPIKK